MDSFREKTLRLPAIRRIHSLVFSSFLFCAAIRLCGLLHLAPFADSPKVEALLLLLALATTLTALARTLPVQSVLWAAALTVLISGLVNALGEKLDFPFGSYFYTENMGPRLFHGLPWAVPLLWIVLLLNSREVARLLLEPRRKSAHYGLWVLVIASLLVAAFDLALDPYASRIKGFWRWQAPQNMPTWYSAPCISFPGCAILALLILALITPWLIHKQPMPQPPGDFCPLTIWLGLYGLLGIENLQHSLWGVAGLSLAIAGLVAFYARRAAHARIT